MKLHFFSKKVLRGFGAGLAASVLLSTPVAVYAQVGTGSNNSTVVIPHPENGTVTSKIISFNNLPYDQKVQAVQLYFQYIQQGFFGVTELSQAKPQLNYDSVVAGISNHLVKDGATAPTAKNTAVVLVAVSEDHTRDIIASITNPTGVNLASSTGVLVASLQPVAIPQTTALNEKEQSVEKLYNRFNQAFIASGLDETEAKTNAKNLVLAIAGVKTSIKPRNQIDVKKVNELARLIEPANKALPGMLKVVSNNPSPEAFHQIKDTVTALETVGIYVKAVQDSM